jgi:hypothetical protein
MFKRILTLATGVMLGVGLALFGLRTAQTWSFWPNRELDRASTRLKEVLQLVNENYVEAKPAAYAELATAAMHGLAESLDPHSEFLEIKDNKSFEEELTGEFGGIGIQVESRGGRVLVIAPIADTPGERAGIRRPSPARVERGDPTASRRCPLAPACRRRPAHRPHELTCVTRLRVAVLRSPARIGRLSPRRIPAACQAGMRFAIRRRLYAAATS